MHCTEFDCRSNETIIQLFETAILRSGKLGWMDLSVKGLGMLMIEFFWPFNCLPTFLSCEKSILEKNDMSKSFPASQLSQVHHAGDQTVQPGHETPTGRNHTA